MRDLIDKIEAQIERPFTFLNKKATNTKDRFLQAALALGMAISFFALMGYVNTLMIGA